MTPWVMRLIVANAVMFFLSGSLPPDLMGKLVLRPIELPREPWTMLTYMFLHGGFGHIFLNMLMLFFFGPRLEVRKDFSNTGIRGDAVFLSQDRHFSVLDKFVGPTDALDRSRDPGVT